jgi:hypothetical protein
MSEHLPAEKIGFLDLVLNDARLAPYEYADTPFGECRTSGRWPIIGQVHK